MRSIDQPRSALSPNQARSRQFTARSSALPSDQPSALREAGQRPSPFRSASRSLATAAVLVCALGFGSLLRAQSASPGCTPSPTVNCPPAKSTPPKDDFPFPGEPSQPNKPTQPSQPAGSSPTFTARPPAATPDPADPFPFPGQPKGSKPASGSGKPAGSGDPFPFPGESPSPGAASAPNASGSGASGSSSSSSSSGVEETSDTDPGDADPVPAPPDPVIGRPARRKLAKGEDTSSREDEDLNVSHFYLQSGNYPGAYARAQDAVRLFPDDPDAHFALAEAARKLKKTDEARAEYTLNLKLDPDGTHAGDVKKALAQLH